MRTSFLYFLMLICFSACNNNQQEQLRYDASESHPVMKEKSIGAPVESMASTQPATTPSTPITEPKIIKNANVRLKVNNLHNSLQQIQAIIKKHGGYLTSSTESRNEGEITSSLTIRVDHTKFELLLDELQTGAVQVDYKHIYAQDVTEEYIDIEARLSNRKRLEQRLLELLAQAKTVEDIIKVEAQLATVREQIESFEGRLKYLNDRILHSTINLELYETIPLTTTSVVFFSDFINAFSSGWKIFLSFIITMAAGWPFLIVLAALLWWLRHRRKKRANSISK